MNDEAKGRVTGTQCPYCGARAAHLISSTDRNRGTTTQIFDYFQCPGCGLIFMDPTPEDLAPYYKGGYDRIPETAAELRTIAAEERYRTEPVLKYKRGGRCLEIGPWRGVICSNMKDAGFEVTAIEMNGDCVRFLRDELGVEAIQSADPAETLGTLKQGFDVIIAWHSLEHLPEAWRVIERSAELLAPGGIVLLAMPNPESYELSVLGNRWMHLDAPRHLYFFPLKTLIEICKKNGLEPLETTTADKFSDIQSKQAWQSLARSWIPVRYVRYAMAVTVGNLMYRLARGKQRKEGLGSAYMAMFRRG